MIEDALAEELINTLTDDANIICAITFGSHAAGKQKKASDLDIAIYFVDPPEGKDNLV
jgi:predicted nucleotidyltransferase